MPEAALGDKVTLVFVQVNGPSLLAVTLGAVVLPATVTEEVAVQPPCELLVTVTVYIPAEVAVAVAPVPSPPLQL